MEDIFNFKKPARPCGVFNIPFEQSKELITVIEITPLSYIVKETCSYRSILLVKSRFCDVLTSIAMSKKHN